MMVRRIVWSLCFGRHRKHLLILPLAAWTLLALVVCWALSKMASIALLPPPPPDHDLTHFRRNRSLKYYLDDIQLLIEPSSLPCQTLEEVPVIVVVTSAPTHFQHRDVIRSTWGKHLPTYFIMGLDGPRVDDQLIDNYVEAKQYSDMIVFEFQENYQNLTLKTALMMKWSLERCPHAEFLYKTDDDSLVNPWMLKKVLKENRDAKVLGYMHRNARLHRDEYNKWFLPRWLCHEDLVPQYITGPGYLISGDYIKNILVAANDVPLINMEDIYFTYLVANQHLGYKLTHDVRLSPYRPWPPLGCAYWVLASVHSLKPHEMLRIWSKVAVIGKEHDSNEGVCQFYRRVIMVLEGARGSARTKEKSTQDKKVPRNLCEHYLKS